jgi:taurine transport system ATP-binding protein
MQNSDAEQPVLSLAGIGVVYEGKQHSVDALTDITLEIKNGEFVCLLGPSGCGKSTLLNIIAGFIKPSRGEARVDGEIITGPDWNRGVVFQTPSLYPWLTVQKNVEFGLRMRKFSKQETAARADRYLKQVGLSEFKKHKPYELSGGMRQRACLARVLTNNPRIILMDEPFGALDAITRENMQTLTRIVWSDNRSTIFLITHDVDEALSLGTRILVMSRRPGKIIKEFTAEFTYHITGRETDRTRFSREYIEIREQILMLIHGQTEDYVI